MVPLLILLLAAVALWMIYQIVVIRQENERLSRRLLELERETFNRQQVAPEPRAMPPPVTPVAASVEKIAASGLPTSPASVPPPLPRLPPERPIVNWERFTGANLLAWIGGLAAFLGAAFFVKYSFEHDLIPPAMRVAIGYVFAIGLVVGGLRIPRQRYAITAQTLCATGIVCLYAVTFACNSIYHFPFFGPVPTFVVMLGVTTTAFAIAVKLDAQVVAVLGLVGGFLTPELLGSREDNPAGLFGYVALLDLGLLAIALRVPWHFLVPLASAGTIATQLAWAAKFLRADNAIVAVVVCLGFSVLFVAGYALATSPRFRANHTRKTAQFLWPAVVVVWTAFLFALRINRFDAVSSEPPLLFAFALGAAVSLLVVTWLTQRDAQRIGESWVAALALAGVAAVEYAWHGRHFQPDRSPEALGWYAGFYAIFAVYPFLFGRRFADTTGPWAVAALAGVVQFLPVFWLFERTGSTLPRGLIPALFMVAPAASFVLVQTRRPDAASPEAVRNQLAWFAGVALFFATLIIPVQFKRQWITIGWAAEGVALLWCFRRLPHVGLRLTGLGLLGAAFVRLTLNPAVLEYHPRSATPIFNWYLYAYGLVAGCVFAGAGLLAEAETAAIEFVRRALLAMGTVLVFLLLNIEIADYFTPAGAAVLTFQFSGHLGRDMTYTIAWALFALTLLLLSMWKQARGGRLAALALFAITVAKLFLHDLAHLSALHRIAALFAVAIIAIGASIAYQRFLAVDEPETGGGG